MHTIVLVMQRRSIAEGLIDVLEKKSSMLCICFESNYSEAEEVIKNCKAEIALIEVDENEKGNILHCFLLCAELRKSMPECKLILLCSEQDKSCIRDVISAKKDHRIDEFVFYDTSVEYLAAKLISLTV